MAVRLEHVETLTLARGRQAFTIHREYLLFAPPGWQRWWLESQKKYSRGLPLVVSLHGAGMDHHLMAYQWQYDSAWRDDLDHQFFVLVPGGTLTLDGLSSTDEPFRPFDEKLIWNGSDTAVETSRDDVALVQRMVDHARGLLSRASPDPSLSVWDDDRMFLHGYSNGTGLAHRLVAEEPGRWAAIWAKSGMMARRLGTTGTPAVFGPDPALVAGFGISCFVHHGLLDTTIPYGADQPPGTFLVGPGELVDLTAGGLSVAAAREIAFHYGIVPDCVERYRRYNHLRRSDDATKEPSVGEDESSLRWVHPLGSLLNDGTNPQVVEYRDPAMGHTNLNPPANGAGGYGSFSEVWDFFRTHPRVARPT